MNKNIKIKLLEDFVKLGIGLSFFIIFLFFHYYNESKILIFKLFIAHLFLFILPGYFLTLYYFKTISFSSRLGLSLGVGYGIQPLLIYLINILISVNILKFNWIISFLMIFLGGLIFYIKFVRVKSKK